MTTDTRGEVAEVIENVVADLRGVDPVTVHQVADEIMRGLFSPRVGPCPKCGGTGERFGGRMPIGDYEEAEWRLNPRCPAPGCDDGQVVKAPLAYLAGSEDPELMAQASRASGFDGHSVKAMKAALDALFRLRPRETT